MQRCGRAKIYRCVRKQTDNWVHCGPFQSRGRYKLVTALNSRTGWDSGDQDLYREKMDCLASGWNTREAFSQSFSQCYLFLHRATGHRDLGIYPGQCQQTTIAICTAYDSLRPCSTQFITQLKLWTEAFVYEWTCLLQPNLTNCSWVKEPQSLQKKA